MQVIEVRDATPSDFPDLCALNLTEVQHTSPMSPERLAVLDALSCYHRVACVSGQVAAFLLAMRGGAAYENDNFAWFSVRYENFIYVDRIVVSAAFQGMRLGTRLYEDLFRFAVRSGCRQVTCEYNISPPNEPSRRFHDRFGFRECGTQWVAQGSKQVSLQVAALYSADPATGPIA
jgi:predicted GNAT superfamily acetyltransferase